MTATQGLRSMIRRYWPAWLAALAAAICAVTAYRPGPSPGACRYVSGLYRQLGGAPVAHCGASWSSDRLGWAALLALAAIVLAVRRPGQE